MLVSLCVCSLFVCVKSTKGIAKAIKLNYSITLLPECHVHLNMFILLVCVVAQFGHQGAVLKN